MVNPIWVMSLKLLLAGVLGGAVGYEREMHEHPAGLRTHILVCIGSTLITLISVSFLPPLGDPSRIAAQIVSGIGFLGAGTILRQGSIVRGLTTAASLWAVSGIGMAVGIGGHFLILSVVATLIVFITLSTLRFFEPKVGRGPIHGLYLEVPVGNAQILNNILTRMTDLGIAIRSIRSVEAATHIRAYDLMVMVPPDVPEESIMAMLTSEAGLNRFDWA